MFEHNGEMVSTCSTDTVIIGLSERITELESELADKTTRMTKVIEAARGIQHWSDVSNVGMVVSGAHVHTLWQALRELDEG